MNKKKYFWHRTGIERGPIVRFTRHKVHSVRLVTQDDRHRLYPRAVFLQPPPRRPISRFFLHRFDKGSELWANGINLFQIEHDIISKSNGKRTKNNQIYSWLLDKVAKRIKKINIDWMIINWLIGFDRFLSLEWRKLIVMKKVSLILLRDEISTLARNNSK